MLFNILEIKLAESFQIILTNKFMIREEESERGGRGKMRCAGEDGKFMTDLPVSGSWPMSSGR
jgi:hypothetical protein